jgi:hypothetical protein
MVPYIISTNILLIKFSNGQEIEFYDAGLSRVISLIESKYKRKIHKNFRSSKNAEQPSLSDANSPVLCRLPKLLVTMCMIGTWEQNPVSGSRWPCHPMALMESLKDWSSRFRSPSMEPHTSGRLYKGFNGTILPRRRFPPLPM